jgi:hypothetical protein
VLACSSSEKAGLAAAELLYNAVMRNGLSDHSREILRPPKGQVNESREFGGVSRGWLAKNRDIAH